LTGWRVGRKMIVAVRGCGAVPSGPKSAPKARKRWKMTMRADLMDVAAKVQAIQVRARARRLGVKVLLPLAGALRLVRLAAKRVKS